MGLPEPIFHGEMDVWKKCGLIQPPLTLLGLINYSSTNQSEPNLSYLIQYKQCIFIRPLAKISHFVFEHFKGHKMCNNCLFWSFYENRNIRSSEQWLSLVKKHFSVYCILLASFLLKTSRDCLEESHQHSPMKENDYILNYFDFINIKSHWKLAVYYLNYNKDKKQFDH